MQRTKRRSVWLLLTVIASACADTAGNPGATSSSTPNVGVQGSSGSSANSGMAMRSPVVTPAGGNGPVAGARVSQSPAAGAPSNSQVAVTTTTMIMTTPPGMLGVAGESGAPAAAGSGASPATNIDPDNNNGKQPKLPAAPAMCPTITTGMITVMGQQVRLWVGPQKGPMVFYWHGTGSRAEEAISGLGPGLNEIMSQGGVVASFTTTTQMGRTTGNNVWYTTDYDMADQILACANQQGLIDPQRIYSAGCSAGGIHTSTMAYARSGYLAASAPNSGGIIFTTPLQDTAHVPFQISSHGAREKDLVRSGQANAMIDVYFADITANNNKDLVAKGGFAVNCDHGGEHCANPPALTAAMWTFMKAHTFSTMTSPYAAGLPTEFPAYCQIVR